MIDIIARGIAATKADLVNGKVPQSQLPSYVDDVIEVENYAALPEVGESGKIYVTLDDNKTYRWSGSTYIQIGGGTSEGTEAGQVKVWNGTEWINQSGYGYVGETSTSTWSGEVGSFSKVVITEGEYELVKVSEQTPSKASLTGKTLTIYSDGSFSIPIPYEEIGVDVYDIVTDKVVGIGIQDSDGWYVVIAYETTTCTIAGTTVTLTPGTWFTGVYYE